MKRSFLLICMTVAFGLNGYTQNSDVSLDDAIRLAQDSVIVAFQNQHEFEFHQHHYAEFMALRKPQLTLRVVPNYARIVNDPDRDYVYLRNYDILSSSAQVRLTQKALSLGGEAYVGFQAIWSEYFGENDNIPRQFVATPLILGYRQLLLGYNPYRWEKLLEDQRLNAAKQQHAYELRLIAEETTQRFFKYVCAKNMRLLCETHLLSADTLYAIAKEKAKIAIVTLAELRSLELQYLNAGNALEAAMIDEQKAGVELLSYLRKDVGDTLFLQRLQVPQELKSLDMSVEQAILMVKANSPAYQQQLTALLEARHQEEKARKESGLTAALDVNVGLQQVGETFGAAFRHQQTYAIGSMTLSVPLMDHGASKKRRAAASAWTAREEDALNEVERTLCEDVINAMHSLQIYQQLLARTKETVELADEVFLLSAENYANGLTDINTYTLAQDRRDNSYHQYLSALGYYWTTYYHIITLTQYE